jgi:hypothetical protein
MIRQELLGRGQLVRMNEVHPKLGRGAVFGELIDIEAKQVLPAGIVVHAIGDQVPVDDAVLRCTEQKVEKLGFRCQFVSKLGSSRTDERPQSHLL